MQREICLRFLTCGWKRISNGRYLNFVQFDDKEGNFNYFWYPGWDELSQEMLDAYRTERDFYGGKDRHKLYWGVEGLFLRWLLDINASGEEKSFSLIRCFLRKSDGTWLCKETQFVIAPTAALLGLECNLREISRPATEIEIENLANDFPNDEIYPIGAKGVPEVFRQAINGD